MDSTNADDPRQTTDPSLNAAEQGDDVKTDFSAASALERTGPYLPNRKEPPGDGPPERLTKSAPAVPGYKPESEGTARGRPA
jgi:hypothetical protein